MERAWGETAVDHAAEVAYPILARRQRPRARNAARTMRIAAADNAEAAYAHDEVAAFLRIALELLPEGEPRRPRILARLGRCADLDAQRDGSIRIGTEAGEMIAASEGPASGSEYYEQIARAMFNAGLTPGRVGAGARRVSDMSAIGATLRGPASMKSTSIAPRPRIRAILASAPIRRRIARCETWFGSCPARNFEPATSIPSSSHARK